jgi:tetratricopeptide (TPR) repeat protein
MRRRLSHLSVLALAVLLAAPAVARAERQAPAAESKGDESLDQKAKRLFAAGRYSEAIEILAQLYAQTNNPVYLRNIGRCYQRLPDPDRAIASFEEYLLRGKNISRSEREEIRGFIRELQDLKRRNTEAAAASEAARRPPAPNPSPPPSTQPAPTADPPATTGLQQPAAPPAATDPPQLAPAPVASLQPAPAPPPPIAPTAFPPAENVAATAPASRPIGRTLGIVAMGVAGALAVSGGVVLATSWSRFKSAEKTCLLKANCGEVANTVDSRNRLAKILLVGAAVTGAAGVTVYLINPGGRAESGMALAVGGRF